MRTSILEDAGEQAFTCGSTGTALGVAGQSTNPRWGALVQVRRADLDTARAILLANRRDSIDIDWDHVDVGTESRIDDGSRQGGTPLLARIGWLVAVTLVVLGLLLAIISMTT